MNGRAYYNENDAFAAQWLRNLIAAGLIAPGDVDERSIVDVRPNDVRGYTQCHFFAGIGIWSGSLRDAGIRDTDHVWTGSCPCQPFSAAGQRGGFADERHLWPAFFHLIEECRPSVLLGEQVASPDGLQWLDLVSSDLEGAGYAVGAADLCAAGIAVAAGETEVGQPILEWIRGAVQSCPDPFLAAELRDYAEWFDREAGVGPAHIRQRLCWMAYATDPRSLPGSHAGIHRGEKSTGPWNAELVRQRDAGNLADTNEGQRGRIADRKGCEPDWSPPGWQQGYGEFEPSRSTGEHRDSSDQRLAGTASMASWTRADWIICTDGKARPIEPGTFPLAHGQSNRVGRLRAYGNAMHRAKITQFILAAQEAIGAQP